MYGREFDVITDHNPLQWLDNARDPHSRLSRWSLTLQSYAYTIKHRPGKLHGSVNALSRMPHPTVLQETNVYAIESPGLQLNRVKELQSQDPSLRDLIDYYGKSVIPEDSVSARRLMATVDDYVFEEGVLYHLDKG